jgi:CRISPR-associated endonuclease/helicase Cas3
MALAVVLTQPAMMLEQYIFGYWGKAQSKLESEQPWHPLGYHSLDVAAVADVLLARSPRKLAHLSALCGTAPQSLRRFLVALIALHDIGKFSHHFQAKSDIGWQASVHGPRPVPKSGVRHDAIGYKMLDFQAFEIDTAEPPARLFAIARSACSPHTRG